MDFLVIFLIMVIVSAGILNLTPDTANWAARAYRLPLHGLSGIAFFRENLTKAAAAAGRQAAFFRTAKKRELVHGELYSALSILRNYASSETVTTDFLLESFAESDGILKDAYSGALRFLRTGRRAEAASFFANFAGIAFAQDFILLVLDWDAVSAGKQKQMVLAFQSALRETRTTELMRKNEVMSDLVYLPVVAGILVIFVNFIYVAYFAEQSALLRELFF